MTQRQQDTWKLKLNSSIFRTKWIVLPCSESFSEETYYNEAKLHQFSGKQEYSKTISIRKCIRIIYHFLVFFLMPTSLLKLRLRFNGALHQTAETWWGMNRSRYAAWCVRILNVWRVKKGWWYVNLLCTQIIKTWNSPSIYFVNASINVVNISWFVINHIWYLIYFESVGMGAIYSLIEDPRFSRLLRYFMKEKMKNTRITLNQFRFSFLKNVLFEWNISSMNFFLGKRVQCKCVRQEWIQVTSINIRTSNFFWALT